MNPKTLTLPSSDDFERSALGSLMLVPHSIADVPELTEDYFTYPAHKRIFRVITQIAAAGGNPDLLSVTNRLRDLGQLDDVGGPGALTEMYAQGTASIDYCLRELRNALTRRRIIQAASKMSEAARDMSVDAADALAIAGEEILSIDASGSQDTAAPASAMIHGVLAEFERALAERGAPRGVPTGYRDFDLITGGLRGGQLILIAGRPAMGKSALMLNMADRMAAKEIPVLIYSLEMKRNDLMQRIICSRARVSSSKARVGSITADEQKRISIEGMVLAGQPLYIDDAPAPMILDLRARARREVKRNGIKCIFVDYVQLVRSKGHSRENEVGEVSRNLKALAMELDIPVVCAAQLNRQAESRGDNRPKLSDLRESGSLEQDADIVTLIFRPEYYNGETKRVQEAEWTVAKHREGRTGPIPLVWNADFTRFDTAEIHREPPQQEAFEVPRDLLEAINE